LTLLILNRVPFSLTMRLKTHWCSKWVWQLK
jgi:hypothetical protein